MDDRELISLLFERSEQAIPELKDRFGRLIRKVAVSVTGSEEDAEEIENDTYLALWERIPPEKPDPLGAYVCAAARNLSLKRRRASSAGKRSEGLSVPLEELDNVLRSDELSERLSARELGELINSFLSGLDKQSRTLFIRRCYFCESVGDAARALGISENNASVKLSRIRQRLKKHLEKEGYVI